MKKRIVVMISLNFLEDLGDAFGDQLIEIVESALVSTHVEVGRLLVAELIVARQVGVQGRADVRRHAAPFLPGSHLATSLLLESANRLLFGTVIESESS